MQRAVRAQGQAGRLRLQDSGRGIPYHASATEKQRGPESVRVKLSPDARPSAESFRDSQSFLHTRDHRASKTTRSHCPTCRLDWLQYPVQSNPAVRPRELGIGWQAAEQTHSVGGMAAYAVPAGSKEGRGPRLDAGCDALYRTAEEIPVRFGGRL